MDLNIEAVSSPSVPIQPPKPRKQSTAIKVKSDDIVVELRNLESRPSLNGLHAIVLSYDTPTSKYEVQLLDSGQKLEISENNLNAPDASLEMEEKEDDENDEEILHPLVLDGQPEGELQHDCMGFYEMLPGKETNGRAVWQKTDPVSPARFLFYAETKEFPYPKQWFAGTLEQMSAGKPEGLLSVEGEEAVTPDLADAEWQAWDEDEEDWEDAEEITCKVPPRGARR